MAAATDAESVLALAFPASVQKAVPGFASAKTKLLADLSSGQIQNSLSQANCTKINTGPTNLQKASKGVGVAAGVWGSLAPSIAALQVVPVVGQIIGGIITAFGFVSNLLAKHSQAVAKEQGTLCAVVPQINAELKQVDMEFSQGNISFAEASAELDSIASGYRQATASITKESPGSCNAGCVIGHLVDGEVIYRKQNYSGQSPMMYYIKHYWWVGLIAGVALLFFSHRVVVKGA